VRGYLLDTNHVDPLFREEPGITARYNAVPDDWQVRLCTITLGEIEAGNLLADPFDEERQEALNQFLNEHFISDALPVSVLTRIDYATLVDRILDAHPRLTGGISIERHLSRNLHVDINDLWIVSVAREHNLTFCTKDGMPVIRAAAYDVQFDDWLV
jgi:predicted nucleic acid-binding protein